MARVVAVQPFPASLEGLLALLADPAAFQAKVAELQALLAVANARVAAVGVAEEIETLRHQAAADRQMAAETLADAKRQAAEIVEHAITERTRAQAAASAASRTARATRDDLTAQATRLRVAQEAHAAVVARDQEALVTAQAEVAAAKADAEALRARAEATLARLRTAGVALVEG